MLIVKNKKAYFDYDILDSWEAGIDLRGHEVKSIRQKHVNLKGSYISAVNHELYIKGMHVSLWKGLAPSASLPPDRERKVLLHKKTVSYLIGKVKESGVSIIPLELYFKGSLIKLRVGLVQGRKAYQKKQVLKERTMDKEAKMQMSKYV